jgi:hypothetical protein
MVISRVQHKTEFLRAYILVIVATLGLLAIWVRPWQVSWAGLFVENGDLLWATANAAAHMEGGVTGLTARLGWPAGYSPWSFPQLGLLFALSASLAGSLGASASLALYVSWATGACLNSVSVLYLFRSIIGSRLRVPALVLSVSVGAGAFTLTKLLQPNVAAFFIFPFVVGISMRYTRSSHVERAALLAAVVLLSLLSGAWWAVVSIVVLLGVAVAEALRCSWSTFRSSLLISFALIVGLIPQEMGRHLFGVPYQIGGTRSAWDSNVYGGHLVDLVLSAPLANSIVSRLETLREGASLGSSLVGLVPALGALLALAMTLRGMPRIVPGTLDLRILSAATQVTLLAFLLGGLGNLQAGLAVLMGLESPARVWSRLIVLLSVLGLSWGLVILIYLQVNYRRSPFLAAWVLNIVVPVVAVISWSLDARTITPVLPEPPSKRPEFAAVEFLSRVAAGCPVAQLPVDAFPQPRVASADIGYRGFAPFILSQDNEWSFGSWTPTSTQVVDQLPERLVRSDIDRLTEAGYCAVLFDRKLAGLASRSGVSIQGRDVSVLGGPEYSSSDFSVFLLN